MSTRVIAIALILPFCVAELRAQAQPKPEYGIKEDHPSSGSRIRQLAVGPAAVPVNLPYERLSPADRAKFNENYESMPSGDEPPFPQGGLKAVLEPIYKAQVKLLVSGDLFLIARVDANGAAQSVTAVGSPSPEITKFAASVLVLTKFKPAMCSGQPCSMEFPLRMRFKVE
jgi:hypothetical protein